MLWAMPQASWAAAVVAVALVANVNGAGLKSTVLASVESSLERCRATVTQHRTTLSSCDAARQPSPCVCLCPTCLPEEWPHRKEPPPCTTPKPPPVPVTPAPAPPAPATGPPAPMLPPLKVLPPYTQEHLPTVGPFPATVLPTTTTLFPPPPPPGECAFDGIYRGNGKYKKLGKGLCVDQGGIAIPFKKRRELTEKNFECICKEACDKAPGCMGYSTNANDDGFGLACRVYGTEFPDLVDRWLDLNSVGNPRFQGKKIVGADGEKGMTCFKRMPEDWDEAAEEEKSEDKKEEKKEEESFVQKSLPPPQEQVSFVVRETSTSELLLWQREQLARCRDQEASLVSLIKQRGCRSSVFSGLRQRSRARTSTGELVMPNECQCHCPDCNFWQLPPPVCQEPTPPPTAKPEELPPGVVVVTGPPQQPTPPPLPVQVPLPPMPPIGNQFLPTLAPHPIFK